MGKLKPAATLIYERDGDTVYQREAGANPATRTEVGYDYEETRMKKRHGQMMEDQLWHNIRRAAHTNPALQDILDHAIMVYQLTKIK
jgi:hypothetical protein